MSLKQKGRKMLNEYPAETNYWIQIYGKNFHNIKHLIGKTFPTMKCLFK